MVQSMPCHHLYGFGILFSLGEMCSIMRRPQDFLVITMCVSASEMGDVQRIIGNQVQKLP